MEHVIAEARTPEDWCNLLRARGFRLSARTIRQKAREHGAYYAMGRAMLLLPEHVEAILKAEARREAAEYRTKVLTSSQTGGRTGNIDPNFP